MSSDDQAEETTVRLYSFHSHLNSERFCSCHYYTCKEMTVCHECDLSGQVTVSFKFIKIWTFALKSRNILILKSSPIVIAEPPDVVRGTIDHAPHHTCSS